jgi:hypothetical protein
MAQLRNLQYPKPQGKPVDVNFPFRFQAEKPPPAGSGSAGSGDLPKQPNLERVVATVQGLGPKIHDCAAGLTGKAELSLAIGPGGRAMVLGIQGVPQALKKCIRRAVISTQFEKSVEGTKLVVPLVVQ